MIVVIDNYDSFTYNLVQYLGELGEELRVYRNDKITLDEIERLRPSVIGIYCMITMQDEALSLAAQVRGKALTVVGGPYPSGEPETFVDQFDLVAVGEGEETIVSIMEHLEDRRFEEIAGLVFKPWDQRTRTSNQIQPVVQQQLYGVAGTRIAAFQLPPGASLDLQKFVPADDLGGRRTRHLLSW